MKIVGLLLQVIWIYCTGVFTGGKLKHQRSFCRWFGHFITPFLKAKVQW